MRNRNTLLTWSPLLLLAGCLMTRLDTEGTPLGSGGDSGGDGGSGSSSGSGGTQAVTPHGTAGDGAVAGMGGEPEQGGTSGMSGSTSGGDTAGGMAGSDPGGGGGTGGSGGGPWKSSGCGKTYTGNFGININMIDTSGVKDADCAARLNGSPVCGPWSTPRNYYVYLPANYDINKAYNLILLAPTCGGNGGTDIYPLNDNVNDTAIRVGIAPGPVQLGHGTKPLQDCFDDNEGDDSIDFALYEALYDRLQTQLCFDRNRLYAGGNGSGATLANELGCKYAGDANRPVRGVLANTGSLPTEPQFRPTCTNKPMAGMWVHEVGDPTNVFSGTVDAVNRAMVANGCLGGTYAGASFSEYTIPTVAAGSCKKMNGCPAAYPLVICPLPGTSDGRHDSIVNPGFSQFVTELAPALE